MKILIIRLSSLGDIVLTQSVTAIIKAQYPTCELHYITKAAFIDVVKAFGTCDRIISYEKKLSFHYHLRREPFDLVIDLQGKLSSRLISFFCRAEQKVGYNKQHLLRRMIVKKLSQSRIGSTVESYLSALAKSDDFDPVKDIPSPVLIPQIPTPQSFIDIRLSHTGKKIIALFPGAAHQTKMYPISKWINLIQSSPSHLHFILLGSPNEKYICNHIKEQVPSRCTDLCGSYPIAELISVIAACDLLLSNDSGPMHLAAALHIAQVAIFGSTHPRLGFAPMNDKAVVFVADLDCQPCSLHGLERCPRGHFNCMNQIEEASVLEAMLDLI